MATTIKNRNKWQTALDIEGMTHITVIDKNHVHTMVDGETEIFSRNDRYSGHPLSGFAYFGGVNGDCRMIQAIAKDIQYAFSLF